MLRQIVLGTLLCFGATSHAFEDLPEKQSNRQPIEEPASGAETANLTKDEPQQLEIIHKRDLATHLGLTSDEAVFRKPRNFRSNALNEMRLDDSPEIEGLSDDNSGS